MRIKSWATVRMRIRNIFPLHRREESQASSAAELVPIQGTILSSDILWRIFDMISSDDNLPANIRLTQIRTCSHVCREWRQILLEAPLLWGRLINIRYNESQHWIEEILQRSKSSPLWFDARFNCNQANLCKVPTRVTDDFFVILLDRCWERIEVIHWTTDLDASCYPETVWAIFQRPAPILKRFAVDVPSSSYARPRNFFDTPIFSDHAPHLEQYENNIIRTGALGKSWFKNLRELKFYGSRWLHSAPFLRLMDILVDLHQLESLDANTTSDRTILFNMDLPNTPLNLPSLARMFIEMTLEQYAHFINRARPARGCNLTCTVFVDRENITLDQTKGFLRGISVPLYHLLENHSICHHRSRTLDSLKLDMDYGHSFTFSCCGSDARKSASFHIRVCYSDDGEPVTTDILTELYAAFKFPILEDVECLDVTYLGYKWSGDRDTNHMLDYMPLLQMMSSVKCLHIDRFLPTFWRDFEVLDGPGKIGFPFPNLDTLFTNMFSYANMGRSPFSELQKLLRCWKLEWNIIQTRRKIPRIELDGRPVNSTALASLVEEFEGLEIFRGSTIFSFNTSLNALKKEE